MCPCPFPDISLPLSVSASTSLWRVHTEFPAKRSSVGTALLAEGVKGVV